MTTVSQILKDKGSAVWSITRQASAFEALEMMAEKNVGALPVVDKGHLVGIFSERDYARKVILKGKASKNTPVSELMTEEVICVTPDETSEDCMALMTEQHIRHLPVLEDNRIVGIVSIGDIVNEIISLQKDSIATLENYIAGRT